jgi:hypothetical protein
MEVVNLPKYVPLVRSPSNNIKKSPRKQTDDEPPRAPIVPASVDGTARAAAAEACLAGRAVRPLGLPSSCCRHRLLQLVLLRTLRRRKGRLGDVAVPHRRGVRRADVPRGGGVGGGVCAARLGVLRRGVHWQRVARGRDDGAVQWAAETRERGILRPLREPVRDHHQPGEWLCFVVFVCCLAHQ